MVRVTRRIVGIDLSLASAGVAIVTETSRGCRLDTEVFKSRPTRTGPPGKGGKPTETLRDRYTRMRDHSATVVHHAARADLVVIEGLVHTPGGAVVDRTALWWIVVGACMRRDVPVAVASPTAMKRVIVGPRPKGSGPVDKVEVALAVQRLWPDARLGNNDTADAAGLAHCGAVALGWPVETLARHRTMVWTDWPESAPVRDPADEVA
jgi:Holliday junction resolvasome RuvABC endonuclease subunit